MMQGPDHRSCRAMAQIPSTQVGKGALGLVVVVGACDAKHAANVVPVSFIIYALGDSSRQLHLSLPR